MTGPAENAVAYHFLSNEGIIHALYKGLRFSSRIFGPSSLTSGYMAGLSTVRVARVRKLICVHESLLWTKVLK